MKARTYKKLLRLNQDEWERLRYLSKSTGLNQEQVLRKVLMDAPLLERPTADYIKMSRQIAALGNNLNQLAHIANASGKVSNTDLLTAKQIMEQIWRYIKGGMPDEIRRMRDDECLLLMRSEDPVIDRKYNLLKHPNVKYTPDAGGEPYVIPPDYMGDAVTITMDAVAAATAPEITEEMYEQLDYLEKHPEENYYENEENFSQYDQGD